MSHDTIHVLLIEDNPGDAFLLREMLGQANLATFDLQVVKRLDEGLEQLKTDHIEVIMLDLSLPDSHGLETFSKVINVAPEVPIIVMSGLEDEELALAAVREGAQDYLVKGQVSSNLLIRAIQYAIERKHTEQELKQARDKMEAQNIRLEALYEIGQTINSTLDPESILNRLIDEAMRITQASHGQVLGVNEENNCFDRRALRGFSPEEEQVANTTLLPLDQGINGEAYQSRQTVCIPDLQEKDDLFPLPNIRTEMAIPIIREEKVLGNLDLQSPQPGAFQDIDMDYLNALTDQVAIALANAQLFQAEREQRAFSEALQEAAAVVSSTLDLDQVLDRILEQVERVVPGDAFNIMLIEDGLARISRWRGYDRLGREISEGVTLSIENYKNLLNMTQDGKPVIIPDTTSDPNWVALSGQEWLRSYVGAPIRLGEMTVGFLNVNGTQVAQFNPSAAQRLQAFANHTATAIQNAQLFKEVRDYADQLEERVAERTAQIQSQYAQLQAIQRSASDGLIVTNQDGDILQANPVANDWLKRTLSPEDAQHLKETIRQMAQNIEQRAETVLELTGLDLELSAAPIAEAEHQGEASTVVAVHDVSHLKALDRMKSRFVSNVSHELRTPIATIKLYVSLLQRTSQEKWGKYVDALAQETDRQARLVENILQISRIDTGRLEMNLQPISLNDLCAHAVASHQLLAQDNEVSLEHQPGEPDPIALIDRDRIMQVLTNLITNAIQYNIAGGHVTISPNQTAAEGRTWASIVIEDSGIGIPESELPQIFDRFFRGEKPQQMQISGTGLGLSIAKEIVEMHGGRIMTESEMEQGTTFTIWLPLADEID